MSQYRISNTLQLLSNVNLQNLGASNIVLYYGPGMLDKAFFNFNECSDLLNHPEFNIDKKTVFYVHGYRENINSESITLLVKAYLGRNDHNILILEYSQLVNGSYIKAIRNSQKVAQASTKFFYECMKNGLNLQNIHLVGHSLGAHVVGNIGRTIKEITGGIVKFPRVTGLDPAFPGFYLVSIYPPISRDVAEFVDIIHTDKWIYGSPEAGGHADFWPNGGKSLQPGCPPRNYIPLNRDDLCGHRRSYKLWAESVSNQFDTQFLAIRAKSWNDFKTMSVFGNNYNEVVVMGLDCPTSASGNYYLQTNRSPPYAMGMSGLIYSQ